MASIKNASPQFISYGADDRSSVAITPEAVPVPKHLPLFYIFAKKGNDKRNLVGSSAMQTLYGSESFDINQKWFNFTTRFVNAVQAQGNVCMIQRVIPKDAGIKANAVIYADILETKIPNYKRNSDGSFVINPDTQGYVKDETNPTIDGFKIKYIQETKTQDSEAGLLKSKTGTMKHVEVTKQSIPDAADITAKGFKIKYKVGDTIDIPVTTKAADKIEIQSNNTAVVDLVASQENGTKSWKAIKAGTAILTISTTGENKIPVSVKISISVQEGDVGDVSNLTITDFKSLLTKEDNSMTLSFTGDDTGSVSIAITDTTVAKLTDKTITGLKNGVTTVTITNIPTNGTEANTNIFTLQVKIDDLPDLETVTYSTMYPLFELAAKYQGEDYNNKGFAITSPSIDVDSKIITATKSLPFKLSLYTRDNSNTSPSVVRSLYGETAVQFSFKQKAMNPNTEARMDFEEVFSNNWFNETNTLLTLRYNDFDYFYFYRDNYETITKKILEVEKNYVSEEDKEWADKNYNSTLSWYDYTTDKQEELLDENYNINIFSCKSTKGVNYFSAVYADNASNFTGSQREVLLNGDTPIFMSGGNDGTFSQEEYERLVIEKLKEYSDADSEVQDLAINVESTFYDTGFSLATKKEIANFISLRKDTNVALSTHDASLGNKVLPLSDIRAIATALRTRFQLAPESEYFGTSVARAIVLGGTGVLRDGSTDERIPLTYELAIKAAKMMGSSQGKWDAQQMFDCYPNSNLAYLEDYQPAFIPAGVKPTLWSEGLVWAQPYDRANYQIPALQTIYDDDTSVLNNYFVMMALGECTKSGDRVFRKHVGTANMTNDEFINAVEATAADDISGVFNNVVSVTVNCIIDSEDEKRGYSWHMVYKLYGNNLKTVGIMSTEVYRSTNEETNE